VTDREEHFKLRPKRTYTVKIAREDMETPGEIMEDGIIYPYGENWKNAIVGPYDDNKYDIGITKRNIDGIVKVLMESGWMDITGPDFWEPITDTITWNAAGGYWSAATPYDYIPYPALRAKGDWYDSINPTQWKMLAEGAENWNPSENWAYFMVSESGEEEMGDVLAYLDQWIISEVIMDIPNWNWHVQGVPVELQVYSKEETTLRLHQIMTN